LPEALRADEPVAETPGRVAWDAQGDGYTGLPIRLHVEPRWRETDEDTWMELYVPGDGEWRRVKKHWTPVLEGLIAGDSLSECEARVAEARPDFNRATQRYIVLKVVRALERVGVAEIVTPDPPEVFADRYEVLRQLGRGGMGVVWLCRDRERGEDPLVAVKHAWNWRTSFGKAQRSIEKEAGILASVDTPRIVSLVDTFHVDDRFHVARDFLEGDRLSSLAGEPDLDEAARVQALRDVGEALVELREAGWWYFDISPDNFYADPDTGRLILGDVGVCRPADEGGVEVSGRPGKRRYADPQLVGGGAADERSQVYALGRLAWKLVTGRIPAARSSLEAVRRQNAAILELLKDSRAARREIAFFEATCRMTPQRRPDTVEQALAILAEGPG